MTTAAPASRWALLARVAPPSMFAGRRARRLVERNLMVTRHVWWVIASGFFEPLFYLLSIGVGIGRLVGHVTVAGGHPVAYPAYVAPALFASSAMNGAVYESTMNVYFKLKFAKTYDAILATPMDVHDVALGEITWALMRGLLYGTVFLGVMVALGDVLSPWAILALPASVLIGFAFAGTGMAATTFMRSWQDFDFVQLAVLPLFLFSGTFYPLSTYPGWLQIVVQCSPLYQGVALVRGLTLGMVGPVLLLHALYLAVMGLTGLRVASRRLGGLLLT